MSLTAHGSATPHSSGPDRENAPLWSTTPSSVPATGSASRSCARSRSRRAAIEPTSPRSWPSVLCDRASAGRDDASTGPARLTLF